MTPDIYPADFNWMSNWTLDDHETVADRLLAAQGEVQGVKNSGICERTVQLDYDEEVVFKACGKIHDYARSDDTRPFCLVTSMTHPHIRLLSHAPIGIGMITSTSTYQLSHAMDRITWMLILDGCMTILGLRPPI